MSEAVRERIGRYRSEARQDDRGDRLERLRRFYAGDHWQAGTTDMPSIELAWMCVQRIKARLLQGYNLESLKVVPQGDSYYTVELDHPLRQILGQVPLSGLDDASREAELRTALLRVLMEQAGAGDVIDDLAETVLAEGEAALLVGLREGQPWLEVLTADQLFIDRKSKRTDLSDSRFIGYSTERTAADLRRQYPELREYLDDADDLKTYTLECWYLRDTSTTERVERLTVEAVPGGGIPAEVETGGYEIEREITAPLDAPVDPRTGLPAAGPTATGEIVVEYELVRRREVEKYPGGWRLVKIVDNRVVYDGRMPYGDEPPVYWLPCYKLPAKAEARGVLDKTRDMNVAVDRLVGQALRYSQAALPFLAMPEGYLADGELEEIRLSTGQPVHLVAADNDDMGAVGANIASVGWQPLPATYETMVERLRAWMEQIVGADSLLQGNFAWDEASGEAVEQMETAGAARVTDIRRRLRAVIARAGRCLLQASIKYHSRPVQVQVGGATVEFIPQALSRDDFERSFDVILDDSDTLPQTGRRRNRAVLETVQTLAQLPAQILPQVMPMLDLPDKRAFGEIVSSLHEAQQPDQPQVPPEAAKAQIDVQKRYAESLADGLEELAKRSIESDPVLALRALQYLQVAAETGQPPKIGNLIEEISGVTLSEPGQPEQQVPQNVIPMEGQQ